ncbi:hypothetical protein CGRA01v4_08763 [Colletotrichum graminicola]|nr:hypothetical protein CGRA01v4_08763 [Colletotrichum graminicola]
MPRRPMSWTNQGRGGCPCWRAPRCWARTVSMRTHMPGPRNSLDQIRVEYDGGRAEKERSDFVVINLFLFLFLLFLRSYSCKWARVW